MHKHKNNDWHHIIKNKFFILFFLIILYEAHVNTIKDVSGTLSKLITDLHPNLILCITYENEYFFLTFVLGSLSLPYSNKLAAGS